MVKSKLTEALVEEYNHRNLVRQGRFQKTAKPTNYIGILLNSNQMLAVGLICPCGRYTAHEREADHGGAITGGYSHLLYTVVLDFSGYASFLEMGIL